jgi:hypothetical protein
MNQTPEHKKMQTQVVNALRRHSITDPTTITLGELTRIKGLGPKGIAWLAEVCYPHPPGYLLVELAKINVKEKL